ncbi:DUF4982 domain-containing protein [uncultured Draconibacterium sp.]|uniref:DUF4982 domain-containing protein n=1 Tax=uncultured Draconibacterium sp. TaxID=1573823 RepID=UPI0029C69A0D|nr:DUF4982 domain-containing protein [uncultured Draconibacterium sp.]
MVHEPIPEGYIEASNGWSWPYEFPIWNWEGNEGKPMQVRVFTKAPKVSLELNGEVIGEKLLTTKDKYTAVFEVPYQPGELKAIAIEDGKEIATKVLKTAGKPVAIRLTADRTKLKADRNDLSFIKIEVIDENGQLVPKDSIKINLTISGNGELAASGKANPIDMGSVNNQVINTYKGKAQAIIRPFSTSGKIIIKAESEGLRSEELDLNIMKSSLGS